MTEPTLPTSEERIAQLEGEVAQLKSALTQLQQQTVNTVAQQIQHLFTNQVLIDSIASRILVAGANALAFKAQQSNQRAPELQVVEAYVPGSYRAALADDGSVSLEAQVKGSTNAGGGWESIVEDFSKRGIIDQFVQLLAAYGAEVGRFYYVIDSVSLAEHREKLGKKLAGEVGAAPVEEAEAPAPEWATHALVDFLIGSDRTETMLFLLDEEVTVIRGEQEIVIPARDIAINDKYVLTLEDAQYQGVVLQTKAVVPPDVLKEGTQGHVEQLDEVAAPVTLATQSIAFGDSDAVDMPPVHVQPGTVFVVERNGETLEEKVEALQLGDVITISRAGATVREVVVGVNLPVAV
jgi:hypothetical protein